MVRVLASAFLEEQFSEKPGELRQLVDDFRIYKTTDEVPLYFGRDVPYDHPNTVPTVRFEEVKHIHLLDPSSGPTYRVQWQRTSDTHIVYCQGALNDDVYLLIALLSPDAHDQARDRDAMTAIGNIAAAFRRKY